MNMTKEEILKKAKDLITGDRNETHGDAFQNQSQFFPLFQEMLWVQPNVILLV